MRFKIDENIHTDAASLLRRHGHDALTVLDQGMRGHTDSALARICQQESRTIITLDLDFSDVRVYPPALYAGIIILRLENQSRPAVLRVIQRIITLVDTESLVGSLWIVDEKQVRIRGPESASVT